MSLVKALVRKLPSEFSGSIKQTGKITEQRKRETETETKIARDRERQTARVIEEGSDYSLMCDKFNFSPFPSPSLDLHVCPSLFPSAPCFSLSLSRILGLVAVLPDSEELSSCLYRLCVKLIEHIATQCQELFAGLAENEGNSREVRWTVHGGVSYRLYCNCCCIELGSWV